MKELSIWNQLTQLPYLTLYTNVVNSAMQLDIFSQLSEKTTPEKLAAAQGWHEANTRYFLSALYALGFVEKEGDEYWNCPEAERYLVKGKPEYLGGFLLFYGLNEGTAPMDVIKLVTGGPCQPEQLEQGLDFSQYAKSLREAQQGYRQEELLRIVRALPEYENLHTVLDAGCATGLLGLAVIADRPERTGVLFDQPPMQGLIEQSLAETGMAGRATIKTGDFMADDIGSGYDLILAINVTCFAKGRMEALMKKFYDALNPGGVLLCVSEGIQRDFSGPWDMVLGYLPYYLQGMDMGVMRDEVSEAAAKAGFGKLEKRTEALCSGTQDVDILRK